MAQLTWQEFNDSALTTNGLLADLLADPGNPNGVLKNYGLSPLSSADATRWQDILASRSESPSRKEILEYIAGL
ncbi:MAG TPA: hypothetical protein VFG32_00040, partial [Bacteroidota bacterium]|nr:hypothetical protein [Bacteroidota bacterium]